MGITLDGNDNSIHKQFYNALTKNSDSLALSQLWLCSLNLANLSNVGVQIDTWLKEYEVDTWNTKLGQARVNDTVLKISNFTWINPIKNNSDGYVYLWAQGVSFIADGTNISRVGPQQSGATKGMIMDGRLDLNSSVITFLESNVSFVDGFLRPWAVLVGHRSLKDANLRCDIELFCLEKWQLKDGLKVRKSMKFRNAVPMNIDAEEYNYTGDKLIQRQVQFSFDRYEMEVFPDISPESEDPSSRAVVNFLNDLQGIQNYPSSSEKVDESNIYPNQTPLPEKIDQSSVRTYLAPSPEKIDKSNIYPNQTPAPEKIDLSGVRAYPNPVENIKEEETSLQDILGKAAELVTNAKGIANDVTTTVAAGLHAVGLNSAGNAVSRANQRFQNRIAEPVANVISTGQGTLGALENIGSTFTRLTNTGDNIQTGRVDANKIAAELTESAKRTTIKSVDKGEDIISIEPLDYQQ